jgi:hypothetical protein
MMNSRGYVVRPYTLNYFLKNCADTKWFDHTAIFPINPNHFFRHPLQVRLEARRSYSSVHHPVTSYRWKLTFSIMAYYRPCIFLSTLVR